MLSLCLNHRILEQVKYAPPGIRPPGYSTCVSIIESWNKSSMPYQESVHRDIVLPTYQFTSLGQILVIDKIKCAMYN